MSKVSAKRRNSKARGRQSRPKPAAPNPWVVSDDTPLDQRQLLAAQLTAMSKGKVRVEYRPGMYNTYPGTEVQIPGTLGHLWSFAYLPLDPDDGDSWPDELSFDERDGDIRLVLARCLRSNVAFLLTLIAQLERVADDGSNQLPTDRYAVVDCTRHEIVGRMLHKEEAEAFAQQWAKWHGPTATVREPNQLAPESALIAAVKGGAA